MKGQTEVTNGTKLTVGVFILLAIVGTTYYVADGETAYFCEDNNLVGTCFKLSKINDNGIQTRCYYNESSPTRYKNCKTGWAEFKDKIIGNESYDIEVGVDFEMEESKKETLNRLGISQPEISECKKIDNYSCVSQIFQKRGINKPIEIEYHYCEEYNISYVEQFAECLNWKTLTKKEINEKLISESEKLLDSIAEIRGKPKPIMPILSDKIYLNIK